MRLVRASAPALALLVAGTVLPASAHAGDDVWRVPAKATIKINGHGYGHGHGMSQYGAEGAARRGLGFRRIVEFYYPRTTWGKAFGRVRVHLSGDTTDDLVVVARPGLRLRDTAGPARRLPDNGATRWRIMVDREGVSRVAYLEGRWHRWGRVQGRGGFARRERPVGLVTPSGTRQYRGRLWSVPPSPGSRARNTINVLRLENYLKGVVPLEMPALWSKNAVRSQAVAARTYAAYERLHRSGPLCDTYSCQVYGGYSAEHPASNAAINETRRLILRHRGQPAFTQFHSSSGGWTAAGSRTYLPAKRDRFDDWGGNPVHDWSMSVQDGRFERQWPRIGNLRRLVVNSRDGNGEWDGRVRSLTVVGSDGKVTMSGDSFRWALGLRSTWVNFGVRRR